MPNRFGFSQSLVWLQSIDFHQTAVMKTNQQVVQANAVNRLSLAALVVPLVAVVPVPGLSLAVS